MHFTEKYNIWYADDFFNQATQQELSALNPETDAKEIEDRFYQELSFGTGGLRATMGAGTNRMNKYTVGKATMGLGQYLLATHGADACKTHGIVIGYDTRNNSEYFSKVATNVLSGMGIRVYRHCHARPTPQLSFSVDYRRALAGIVITASHNPKEYNGYKVYDEHGCQLIPAQAKQVMAYIDAITDYRTINFKGDAALISMVDDTDNFIAAVLKQSRYDNSAAKANLNIVYTPLHGTGDVPVQKTLHLTGFSAVGSVPSQVGADGNFSTVKSPNPEDPRALALAIAQAQASEADIVLGTDPDADRIGVAVKTAEGYELLTGNQIGALLMDYILASTDLSQYRKPAIVKTVVTSELGAEIARAKGLVVFSTLTGFKFIGEKIVQFAAAKQAGDTNTDYDFVFGYEESYGYLAGTHAKDKDAIVSALLICECAAKLKAEGKTLVDRMEELYATYGHYRDALDSFTLKGKDGIEKITAMMMQLRADGSPFAETQQVIDYKTAVAAEPHFGTLPTSNVLKYVLEDGSWVAVRPSGTEPKIKIYYSATAKTSKLAQEKLLALQTTIKTTLKLGEV